jgi:phosphonate transport system substrate-binding protein
MSTLKRQDQKIQDGLRVIYQIREIAPHPVTAHPRVPAEHMELVRKAFLDMGQSEHGATLLAKVPFKEIGPASLDEYLELASWGLEEHYVRDE